MLRGRAGAHALVPPADPVGLTPLIDVGDAVPLVRHALRSRTNASASTHPSTGRTKETMTLSAAFNRTLLPSPLMLERKNTFLRPPCYGLGSVLMMSACRLREGGVAHFSHCRKLNWFAADKTRQCADLFDCYAPMPNVHEARRLGILPNLTTRHNTLHWTASAARYMLDGGTPPPPPEPCVAVHVRRGDACANQERRCFSDEAYVQAIKKVLVLTDAYVLVIGDDNFGNLTSVLDVPVRSLVVRSPVVAARNMSINAMRARKLLVEQNMDKLGDNLVARLLSDVQQARRCRALVGSFRAGITKLVYSLMTADRGAAPPHHALDGHPNEIMLNWRTCFLS